MRQDLSWALAHSLGPGGLAWARLAAFCEVGLFLPLHGVDVVTGAGVVLVGQHDQPGGGQLPHDAPDPGGGQVVDGAGQRPRHPQDLAVRAGDDLQVRPVPGAVTGMIKRIAASLGGYLEAIRKALAAAPVAHFDETGFRGCREAGLGAFGIAGECPLITIHGRPTIT
jgi:hypothetical protein